jgi:drug/metabolite transporter (DMT)-like permease
LNISFTINISQIPILLFLSLGGFAGSLFLFLKGMKEVGTIKSVMIFSTSSLFGIIFAIIFLNEDVEIYRLIFSLILMMIGIFFITKETR